MSGISIVDAMRMHPVATASEEEGGRITPAARPFGDDAEMADMLAEVDLLGMIRQDTGAQGRKSGDRIDFRGRCPICGHRDCFRYYPGTNSWTCFGAGNTTGYEGGSALEYYKATRTDDDVEAVKWLREATGHPYPKTDITMPEAAPEDAQDDNGTSYFETLRERWPVDDTDLDVDEPPDFEVIEGLLCAETKFVIAGASKSHKSWLLLNLGLSIASGGVWLGHRCGRSHVLYLNMEVRAKTARKRVKQVARALGVSAEELRREGWFSVLNLRRFHDDASKLSQIVRAHAEAMQVDVVILDPLYKAFTGDERIAKDVSELTKVIDGIVEDLPATFIYCHHHSKGNKGDVAAIDRASGSGVFARDADLMLDVLAIYPPDGDEEVIAYEMTFTCREFKSPRPVRTIFEWPLHRIDDDGITAEWKPASAQRNGGRSTAELNKARKDAARAQLVSSMLAYCYREGVGLDGVLIPDAAKALGIESRTLHDALNDCEYFSVDKRSARKFYAVPQHLADQQGEQLSIIESGGDDVGVD